MDKTTNSKHFLTFYNFLGKENWKKMLVHSILSENNTLNQYFFSFSLTQEDQELAAAATKINLLHYHVELHGEHSFCVILDFNCFSVRCTTNMIQSMIASCK